MACGCGQHQVSFQMQDWGWIWVRNGYGEISPQIRPILVKTVWKGTAHYRLPAAVSAQSYTSGQGWGRAGYNSNICNS